MAVVREIDGPEFEVWLRALPESIQPLVRSHPPDRLYRMASTGQRVTIVSYSEDRTVTVDVTGEFNLISFARRVFGVEIDDLSECERPGPAEPVGELDRELNEVFTSVRAPKTQAPN